MYCYQCEQSAKGGCTKVGVCGKQPQAAELMDLLIAQLKQLAAMTQNTGKVNAEVNKFIVNALFVTVTNVNFDSNDLEKFVRKAAEMLSKTEGLDCSEFDTCLAMLPDTREELQALGREFSISSRIEKFGQDIAGLQELLVYGMKGTAAYAHHAAILGQEDIDVYSWFINTLAWLTTDEATDPARLIEKNLECGKINLRVMELLDIANISSYGHPEPTQVRVTPVAGKAILVSGHDLRDLEVLLEQTKDMNINVYTHGEMLPCLAYPELKKHPHLVGNYGGAWQDQQKEFEAFPGAILMTTNCIQKPRESYIDRIFTTGLVGFEGVKHVSNNDFSEVIEVAQKAEGFTAADVAVADEKFITIGFAHNAVLSVADAVIGAVKQGKIRHFFLIGGCDGARPGRNYYTELAEKVPNDCVILTLACGKYRFNKLEFGDIGGIPRLLDIGQCNDAYSAIQIAIALANAFECSVNELPLSLILSWYEQKAVCILLTLLHLGIENIKIGPTLPQFISPAVLDTLVENFSIAPITSPDQDLAEILG